MVKYNPKAIKEHDGDVEEHPQPSVQRPALHRLTDPTDPEGRAALVCTRHARQRCDTRQRNNGGPEGENRHGRQLPEADMS